MLYLVGYVSSLIVFGAADAVWLSITGPLLYKPVLGDILLSGVRVGPAIAFYAMYPVGILIFAVLPGVRGGSAGTALLLGLLFGAIAYATYDLTNFATLRNWTLQIVVVDIVYGAVATGVAAAAACAVVRWCGYKVG
jgi:uncharacterized membrane protein